MKHLKNLLVKFLPKAEPEPVEPDWLTAADIRRMFMQPKKYNQ